MPDDAACSQSRMDRHRSARAVAGSRTSSPASR